MNPHTQRQRTSHPGGAGPGLSGGTVFAATEAFRVLRAWRSWAAQRPLRSAGAFRLLRLPRSPALDLRLRGALVLLSDDLSEEQVTSITGFSDRRPAPLSGAASAAALSERAPLRAVLEGHGDPVCASFGLRSLDDWTIQSFLRAAGALTTTAVTGLRRESGEYVAFAYGVALSAAHHEQIRGDLAGFEDSVRLWAGI